MSQRLISRNPDLSRLWQEGYDVEVRGAFLLVKNVPYVNSQRQVRRGVLVASLTLAGEQTVAPSDHQVWFTGEYPCREDGSPISTIENASGRQELDRNLLVDHRFSNKTHGKSDADHYEKMIRYIRIIAGPAQALDPEATAQVNLFQESPDEESVFAYLDTASSSAGITALARKLESEIVAIVGVGGTGSYVLDLVAKTPVKEIHLFDGDGFLSHSAFRSPGAASIDELKARPFKVDHLADQYGRMHKHIIRHAEYLGPANLEVLRPMSFVFLCLDRGSAKRDIVQKLLEWNTPFIDAGMGVDLLDGALAGTIRVTTSSPEKHDHVMERVPFADADPDADYSRNIQIADLCALNGALAVIKWKKRRGFYHDLGKEHSSAFTLYTNSLVNEDVA